MRKSSAALMTTGIILGVIIIVWQLVPFLTYQKLEVTWTEEAELYYEEWMERVFSTMIIDIGARTHGMAWAFNNAEEIARSTDYLVHLIDARLGMALIWWNISQFGGIFPGRYNWTTAWERLREAEQLAEDYYDLPADWLQVDWSFEAVKYYWNPGDPYFGVPDQPDFMIEVIRLAADGEAEFREMFSNATVEAEELANTTDQVVDLNDLIEAITTILP